MAGLVYFTTGLPIFAKFPFKFNFLVFEFHFHRQNFLKKPSFVHSSFFVFASASFIDVDFTTTQR